MFQCQWLFLIALVLVVSIIPDSCVYLNKQFVERENIIKNPYIFIIFAGSTRIFVASSKSMPLRRAVTMRAHNSAINLPSKDSSWSPSVNKYSGLIRSFDTRTSSMISRNSSRHGRIIRLEQKATKVLGVVFFTFVILWAPFFILNLIPVICSKCENQIDHNIFDLVTWLGYASSTVNPIFYTIFNKTFRQAFKKIIFCGYGTDSWRLYN